MLTRSIIAAVLAFVATGAAAAPRDGIVLVAGGCGFGFHPNPYGVCVPNRRFVFGGPPVVRVPPPCPRFYHRDPDPARPICYPNL